MQKEQQLQQEITRQILHNKKGFFLAICLSLKTLIEAKKVPVALAIHSFMIIIYIIIIS